jgi:hypothetical protein
VEQSHAKHTLILQWSHQAGDKIATAPTWLRLTDFGWDSVEHASREQNPEWKEEQDASDKAGPRASEVRTDERGGGGGVPPFGETNASERLKGLVG